MSAHDYFRGILTAVVIFIFISTGILKLVSAEQEIAIFLTWGYPLWLMYLTGILNIIFAVGLCIRKVVLISAAALMTLLSVAIISNILTKQSLGVSLPAFMLLCALLYIFYLHTREAKERN